MGARAKLDVEQMSDEAAWRVLATSFPVMDRMVAWKRLPAQFTAETVLKLCETGISTSERSICRFVLHVWNEYDNAFTLSDVRTWDEAHQAAFIAWADGRTLGRPLRYF